MTEKSKITESGGRNRLIGICLAAVVALSALIAFLLLRQDLIFLADGDVISAEKSWTADDQVFFRSDDGVQAVRTRDVLFRSVAFRLTARDIGRRLVYRAETIQKRATSMIGGGAAVFGIAVLIVLAAGIGAAAVRRNRKTPVEPAAPHPVGRQKTVRSETVSPRLVTLNDVVRYFFRIYRVQLRVPAEAPGKIEPLDPEPGSSGRRFRFGIQAGGDWRWRYMTIRPIGEGSGSRSQCFYVIYDNHIVVKIPPAPIRDFSDYIHRIQIESEIARTLEPRNCIIPNVSMIMGKIHRFDDASLRPAEQLEIDYIRLLQRSPGLHQFLKIDNEFAFFMDLSRDYFLSHAMAGPAGDDLKSVVAEDAGMLEDCRAFEARYGAEKGWICLELQNLYHRFDAAIDERLGGLSAGEVPSVRQKQDWFHKRLWDAPSESSGGPETVRSEAARLLDRLFHAQQAAVDEYRKMSLAHAQQVSFGRTRPIKEALTENLLDLLHWLERCRVAHRDLKPDNLMVSGDSGRYPNFLASAQAFTIGLIDLETAVICPEAGERHLRQPQLGGTPTYATPSHFLPNPLMERCYDDVDRVFFLQDWHAVTGIIFSVVTGRRLFDRSAGQFPALIRALRAANGARKPLQPAYCAHNRRFWQSAREELAEKINRHEPLLKAVSVAIPDRLLEMLSIFLDRERDESARRIYDAVQGQDVIRNPRTRKDLCDCSAQAVANAMEKAGTGPGDSGEKLGPLFERLLFLKQRQERLKRLQRLIDSDPKRLGADALLELMFERVFAVMDDVKGPVPDMAVAPAPEALAAEEVDDATLSYTHSADLQGA